MKKRTWSIVMLALTVVALGAMTAVGAEKLDRSDMRFAKKAAEGGLAEVQLGQLAAQNAQSQEVKDFGQRMVTDHGKANDELKILAQKKNLTLPTELSGKFKKMHDKLSKVTGKEFDRMYMTEMVKDHEHDVADFRKESQKAKDPDLKSWAANTLPTLEEHLKMAKETAQKLGIKAK